MKHNQLFFLGSHTLVHTFYTREQIKKSLNALLPSHVVSGPEQLEHICKKNAIFPLMIEPNKRTGPHYAIHTYLPT